MGEVVAWRSPGGKPDWGRSTLQELIHISVKAKTVYMTIKYYLTSKGFFMFRKSPLAALFISTSLGTAPAIAENVFELTVTGKSFGPEAPYIPINEWTLCSFDPQKEGPLKAFCAALDAVTDERRAKDEVCDRDYKVANAELDLKEVQQSLSYESKQKEWNAIYQAKEKCQKDNWNAYKEQIPGIFDRTIGPSLTFTIAR